MSGKQAKKANRIYQKYCKTRDNQIKILWYLISICLVIIMGLGGLLIFILSRI